MPDGVVRSGGVIAEDVDTARARVKRSTLVAVTRVVIALVFCK
jgi:hypothetical protein